MDKYKGIESYLNHLTENYRLSIVINDFVGFLNVDKRLAELMQPYMIHKNPFCMQIKSNRELWNRCLRLKRPLLLKSERLKRPFYGMCYCGIGEYIVPIVCNNIVIGVVSAGEFCFNRKISEYKIKKTAREYHFDPAELLHNFNHSVLPEILDLHQVEIRLGIVSEYFSNFYAALISTHEDLNIKQAKVHSGEAYILSHAVEYIKQNYSDKITVDDLAAFCHCSESYINHIFKKNMKVNVKAYINKIRVEHAKALLVNSAESVGEIALRVGFNDPNYFSSVFSRITAVSPVDFRKRFKAET